MRLALFTLALVVSCAAADTTKKTDLREALKPFNDLVGSWRGTGEPEGSRAEKQRGFWTETIQFDWQFKGDDVWIRLGFEKGKHFKSGELRSAGKDGFRLAVVTAGEQSQTLTFDGTLAGKRLTLDRVDPDTKETQRLVLTFLHSNRFLYRYEVKKPDRESFVRLWQVGATKEGVPFAGPADASPECIVSGGKGTMPVSYKGQTYYVCCSGCRDEFKANPEKYIQEYEAKKKKD
jgi:YHS domain-containing protein